jgi:hypothetical protein
MKTKLDQFISRNQKRNSHLYQAGLTIGYDFVVCPISNQRLSMIKDNYITNVLQMSLDKYPITQRICNKRKENIKAGLQIIDATTGLTKYEVGQEKARAVLSQLDCAGVSGYAKKGRKTRATHMANIDKMGRNGYQRQATMRVTTMLPNGLTVEQNAHRKQRDTLINNNKSGSGGASMQSRRVLAPVLEFLTTNNIKYYFDREEYGIKDMDSGNYYFWDLTLPTYKIAIEYQSNAWHADPTLSNELWESWSPPRGKVKTPEEVLAYDYEKARSLYRNRGFVTHYIWQQSEITDIKDLLCFLQTMITKS